MLPYKEGIIMDEFILQPIAAFVATLCFSLLFSVDKKQILFCGLAGGIGWLLYIIFLKYASDGIAVFGAALSVALMARLLAVKRKSPVTIFLIPGIIPLVPGAGIYNTMYSIVTGNNAGVSRYGYETLTFAGAIAIGIVAALSLPEGLFGKKYKKGT